MRKLHGGKNTIKLKSKKKKIEKSMKRYFTKENIQVAGKHIRYSISLATKKYKL